MTPGRTQFVPPFIGDTWATANLSKIDHIVVVMMENRSYDHVLGYRAQGAEPDGADGLTAATMRPSRRPPAARTRCANSAGRLRGNALQLKTRLPKSVGHKLKDVREQLAGQAQRAEAGRSTTQGLRRELHAQDRADSLGVEPHDVLGYYEASDLPFYAIWPSTRLLRPLFLFAPGADPAEPDVCDDRRLAYGRFGEPILDNNNGDNFLLSRATTIYDLLARKGVSWRVYESEPSVTMLRMFARYATNNTDIVPLARLKADVADRNLPALHRGTRWW